MLKTILRIAERPKEEVGFDWCMDSSESDVSLFMIQKRYVEKLTSLCVRQKRGIRSRYESSKLNADEQMRSNGWSSLG